MASLWRYRMRWSGWAGGPGVSTLYASDVAGTPQDHSNAVAGLFADVMTPSGAPSLLPAGVKIAGDPFVDVIDPATGDQTGTIGVTPVAALNGIATGGWADVSGLSLTWITASFIKGRRVKGRTYFVPMAAGAYETDGTLTTAVLASVQAAASQYLGKISEPVVWHRPTTVGGSDGSDSSIAAGRIIDHPSILTSRRSGG
jgi:hypothetical protein